MSPPATAENSPSSLHRPFLRQRQTPRWGQSSSATQLPGEAWRDSFHRPPQWAQIPQPQPHRPHYIDLVCPAWLIDWRKQSPMFLLVQEAKMGSCSCFRECCYPQSTKERSTPVLDFPRLHKAGLSPRPLLRPPKHLLLPPLSVVPPSLASPPPPFTWILPTASSLLPPQALCTCCF